MKFFSKNFAYFREEFMKIAIIGAGMVGSTILYRLVINSMVSKIAIIDINKEKSKAEAFDLMHAGVFEKDSKIVFGDFDRLAESDIVVITAGANQKVGETRLELLDRNIEIFRKIVPEIKKYAKDSIIIVATNPVDVMTEVVLRLGDFNKRKVLGTGCVLDSARFRSVLSAKFKISPKSIKANVIGEHGDSSVLLWSEIDGDIRQFGGLSDKQKNDVEAKVKNSAYDIIKGKGATYYGIASACTDIIDGILSDSNRVYNISSHFDKALGVYNNVSFSMPIVLNRDGVVKVLVPSMNENEKKKLLASVKVINEASNKI
jgi:L-lactate dehydrogenase